MHFFELQLLNKQTYITRDSFTNTQ